MDDIQVMVINADAGGESASCPTTCVFFKLMVSPKFVQASLKRVMSCCRSSAEWAVTAALSAKRTPRMPLSWT